MIYVALLRGINVGGNNKINMQELKSAFEDIGLTSVRTYINSGNIIFSDVKHVKSEIVTLLETVIKQRFSLDINVLVVSISEFRKIMAKLPDDWRNDKDMKGDVLFLWDELNTESLRSSLVIKDGIDQVIFVPGAVIWSVDKKVVTRSGLMKLAGSPVYKKMTIRNINTARKLYAMMSALPESHSESENND